MKSIAPPKTSRILIAEGRKLLREGLCALLERHDDLRVVGEADDGRAALKLVPAMAVDVVVLTVIPAEHGGAQIVQTITRNCPDCRVVVLTMDPTSDLLRELLAVGAHGCLNKESSATELVEAIRTVMDGKTYLSPKLVDVMLNGYGTTAGAAAGVSALKPLAPREREILARIAAGETTKEIARALGVGTKTVETHRRRLMQKLNRYSVAELTKYAIREGLSPLDASV
jgi:DNA-binding NarL/FixJ family response regulator